MGSFELCLIKLPAASSDFWKRLLHQLSLWRKYICFLPTKEKPGPVILIRHFPADNLTKSSARQAGYQVCSIGREKGFLIHKHFLPACIRWCILTKKGTRASSRLSKQVDGGPVHGISWRLSLLLGSEQKVGCHNFFTCTEDIWENI